jgi:hypothetical protein
MKTSDKLDKILPALHKAKSNMNSVSKKAANPYFSSKYADLNSIMEEAEPKLNEQGIMLLQPVSRDERGDFVETMLVHVESGQFISSQMSLVLVKNDMQAAGSAVSYARRYSLQAVLSMQAEDDDGNVASGKSAKPSVEVKKEASVPTVAVAAKKEATTTAPTTSTEKASTPVKGFTRPKSNGTLNTSGGF